ncbi:hypothetical protein B0H16DRAFT_1559185 [Mycena metata]|uniref:Uncharacterized protein n=1 Tax=Mycena metata TaxID=1033252 RepID=A0AAD7H7U9_9AGAR|nr:hypothetical protein B0H16DRAFT_1618544 [Mycena metata]KAJ7745149.1 hypothetical protein B0H16DRAFT_1559185 [Mycena metata]
MNEYPRTINKVWLWNLLPIVPADNDRLAAPSAPTSFVPLWASSAACCKTKRGHSGPVYTEGGHRRKRTVHLPIPSHRHNVPDIETTQPERQKKCTPSLPRVFVSTSNASVLGPSSTAAHLVSMQLAVNHRVGSVSRELGYGTGTYTVCRRAY